jgi:hypothetical protein
MSKKNIFFETTIARVRENARMVPPCMKRFGGVLITTFLISNTTRT